jgi:hypothetical protein
LADDRFSFSSDTNTTLSEAGTFSRRFFRRSLDDNAQHVEGSSSITLSLEKQVSMGIMVDVDVDVDVM